MAYTKTEWKDQNVENPRTYLVRDNGDSTVTLMDAFGTVTEFGTPVNAENMNKIENGIANAVDKDSNQTITGTKVFNGASPIKLGKAGGTYTEIQYTSDGSARLGGLRNIREGNTDNMQMYVASKDGSSILGSIQLNRDDHNGILATAPHPAASTSKSNPAIMTAGRAADPAQNFNLLHRSGDEIFSGVKTGQSNNPRFGFKNTDIDVTANPSAEKSTRIFFSDKNNKWSAEFANYQNTDGDIYSQITANNGDSGTAVLSVICEKSGKKYAQAPTPSDAADSSTKIATTAWVNSRITSIMNSVGTGYTSQKGDNYIKFSNGLIVQWGNYTGNAHQTFPVAFSNTDYGIAVVRLSDSYGQVAVANKSETGFDPRGNQASGSWIAIGY
nr:MAG TPA: Putative tail fiber protein fold, Tail fiber, receptor [Caudoviricetes sp.]